jgi:hypothetical protein
MIEFLASFGVSPRGAIYFIAVLGSIAVELAALVRELGANNGVLPTRYRTRSYPIFRLLFALIAAGPLAILLSAQTDWNAFYIGISAPLIFDRAAAGIKLNGDRPS